MNKTLYRLLYQVEVVTTDPNWNKELLLKHDAQVVRAELISKQKIDLTVAGYEVMKYEEDGDPIL